MDTREEMICSCISEQNKRRSVLLRDVTTSLLMTDWFARPRRSTFPRNKRRPCKDERLQRGLKVRIKHLTAHCMHRREYNSAFGHTDPWRFRRKCTLKTRYDCAPDKVNQRSVFHRHQCVLLNAVSVLEGNGCAMILIMSQYKTGKTSWAGISFPRPF